MTSTPDPPEPATLFRRVALVGRHVSPGIAEPLSRLAAFLVAHRHDVVIEAFELEGRPYALGVLWHPEEDERSRVIGSLVAAAEERVGAGT